MANNYLIPASDQKEERDYVLYDIVNSGTAAGANLVFFAHSEAKDDITTTNMQASGELPVSQSFLVQSIEVLIGTTAATGDVKKLLNKALLELKVNEERILIAPLTKFVSSGELRTTNSTASIDDARMTGFPLILQRPIVIDGGVSFKVNITTGATAPSATTPITLMLCGILTKPQ